MTRATQFPAVADVLPIPMRLPCPACGVLHIDMGEFETKVHHTHSCQECGLTWRPAVVATVGVRFLPGFKNDEGTPAVSPAPAAANVGVRCNVCGGAPAIQFTPDGGWRCQSHRVPDLAGTSRPNEPERAGDGCQHIWEEHGSLARCRICGKESEWSATKASPVPSPLATPEGAGELRADDAFEICYHAIVHIRNACNVGRGQFQNEFLRGANAEQALKDIYDMAVKARDATKATRTRLQSTGRMG